MTQPELKETPKVLGRVRRRNSRTGIQDAAEWTRDTVEKKFTKMKSTLW